MLKSRYTKLGLLAVSGAILIALSMPKDNQQSRNPDSGMAKAQSVATKIKNENNNKPSTYSVANQNKSTPVTTLQTASADLKTYIEFSQHADRSERKKALFGQWDSSTDMLQLQNTILTQKGFAQEMFKGEQAQARLLAIEYLSYLAQNGQRDPIEKAIGQLSERLNQEEWVQGIEHDYVDLLFKYTETLTQEELMGDFEQIVEKSGYSKKTHDLFTTGLSLSETVLLLPDDKMVELRNRLNLIKEQS
ncbi:hypothetical protein L1285_19320 [Pseudoalteromonas sp. DL2-H2.2]|uniref:hypothetical protein n=1 Tax=Pseudoalteromonas sp. DL2-H2.2 TaxID=2908889 RepID=UPI001F452405|nr:hypothetical protein [Pseudoalteromonas sp. DL2-H2.2]MCF2910464.1 hypothetical protein [Pseudoalteromonas sp. DL2-H2.2]